MKTSRYIELTLVFRKEGDKWTGFCKELGTATYADDPKQAMIELKELVTLHLNTLEETGLIKKFFSKRKITVHRIKPRTIRYEVPIKTKRDDLLRPYLYPIQAL